MRSTGYVVIELKTGKFQPEYAGLCAAGRYASGGVIGGPAAVALVAKTLHNAPALSGSA